MWVMRSKRIFVAAIIAAFVACGAIASVAPSAAAEKNAMADIGNVTLTAKNVEALIASYPDVKKAAHRAGQEVQARGERQDDGRRLLGVARGLRCRGRAQRHSHALWLHRFPAMA